MNKLTLLKKILPGLLPLLIFILADEFFNTQLALVIAVVVGNIQLIFIWVRHKRLDRFVLFDTLLIVVLGLIAIALNDKIFVKLKPALIGTILCVLLGISAFSRRNLILMMSQRYMKGIEMNDAVIKQFNRSIQIMFWLFSAHTLLVLYSAFYMSDMAWGFISVGLFYILFGVYFVYEIIRTRFFVKPRIEKIVEWFPVVDEEGKVTGKATRQACHSGKKILHPVVHLHIINNGKQIYLQKRQGNKDIQPGKWDTAVGGHVNFNEKVEDALLRETKEELGIVDFNPKPFTRYKWESEIESELVFSFIAKYNGKITPNPGELEDGKFWSIKEISNNLDSGIFTPNFTHEFKLLHQYVKKIK